MENKNKIHNWEKNYIDIKGHPTIICSCGKEFKGYDEDTAQKNFFLHKKSFETKESADNEETYTNQEDK